MTDEPPETTLRIERIFDAAVYRVFEAWTSVEVLRRWWHAESDWETPSAEVDLRVGGRIRITMRDPAAGRDYGGEGQFTVIEPPRRLAFTWIWDDDPSNPQLVNVEFTAHGEQTTVVLTVSGIPAEAREDHLDGWQTSFDNLEEALRR